MDETAVSVGGRWNYLYRAVDRNGKSIHSLLCEDRSIRSAQTFFRQAVEVSGSGWPQKINLDGNAATHLGLRLLGDEDSRWRSITVRARKYLNNIVEQDHRAIKQRCASMLGLKSFQTAAITFSGIELAHRIRKRQFALGYEANGRALSLKELWAQAISGKSLSGAEDNTPSPLMHQSSKTSPPRIRHPASGIRHPASGIRHPASGIRGHAARQGVVRYPRRVSFGQRLYLLVTPTGGRLWQYRYRYQGRERMLSFGCYPDVPMEKARARGRIARQFLDLGVDPAERKEELRQMSAEPR